MKNQTEDKRTQLDTLLSRRDAAKEKVQRIEGRLEAAKKDHAAVEAECRKKNIDPTKLNEVLQQLQTRYDGAVKELTGKIEKAEQAITPFLEE